MKGITVSVVIPFYNQVNWLIEAVDSVFAQSFKDFEVIVINDGSSEDMSDFLKKFEDKIIYRWKKNGGPASARNLGIDLARGKYIAFLDSDDLWHENKLKVQVNLMEHSVAVWTHTSYSTFKDYNNRKDIRIVDLSYFKGLVFPWCLASSPIATPCIMVRNQFFKENPSFRFNENMRYGQDWFLWINIALKEPLLVISESYTKVRIRGNNAALRARVQIKARTQIWEFMKNTPDRFFGIDKVNLLMRLAYWICSAENTVLESIERKAILNKKRIEIISKFIYVLPYIIFKLFNRFYFR